MITPLFGLFELHILHIFEVFLYKHRNVCMISEMKIMLPGIFNYKIQYSHKETQTLSVNAH